MPSSYSLLNSINFVRPILKNQPLDVMGLEPALTAGNIVLETMLAPPFKWRHNRSSFTFDTVATTPGVTDYQQYVPTFGALETQWLSDANGNIFELNGALSLPIVGDVSRPTLVAPQFDDGAGNITFRLKNAPDAIYTVNLNFQKKAVALSSFAQPWAPFPDEFIFVCNLGFLTLMALLINDARFPIFEQWFISRLLSVQDGLSDQERAIFLGNWTAMTATLNRSTGAVQAGLAGRAR